MALRMKYFVINPKSKHRGDIYAEASRMAMLEYARVIAWKNEELADDLTMWVDRELEIRRDM